jgi:hypothetical protein
MSAPKSNKARAAVLSAGVKKALEQKADSLMNEYYRKKEFANTQENIGQAAIKAGKGKEVKVVDLKGTTTPTAKERLEKAKKTMQSAKRDSSILGHLRMNTRIDAEGKKVLFLEEVQKRLGAAHQKLENVSNERKR